MARRRTDLDEDDVRVRPGRVKSRPRSKDRPSHDSAASGRVLTVDRGRFTCVLDGRDGRAPLEIMAIKARELGRKGVVVGDRVSLVGDVSGKTDSLARIVRVEPRTSVLRRSADDSDPVERVLVANADQLVVVTSLANPEPRPRLIDRCLVAAYDAGLRPLLLLTKADLRDPASLLEHYSELDVPALVTRRAQAGGADTADRENVDGLEAVRKELAGRTSVLVGHSGVGKSTLVNALVPGADRAIGRVNVVTGRGRHTSSSAVSLPLPDFAGWVVDTPGVRSFGLAHVDLSRVLQAFPDLVPGTQECPRGCSHDEPECGLDSWVRSGAASPGRLDSLRRLLRSRAGDDEPAAPEDGSAS